MATLNPYLDKLMQQASQPMQYQQNPMQQQQQQAQQLMKPQQPYTHSYNNALVMKNGTQYNGTHTMTFGNNQTAQALGSSITKDPSYSVPIQTQTQSMQGQQQSGGSFQSSLGYNNNPLLRSVINQGELAMQRTVVPTANRNNALKMLNLGLDYDIRNRSLQNDQQYRNASLGIERDRLKLQAEENKAMNDYRTASLNPKPNYDAYNNYQQHIYRLREQRQKNANDALMTISGWDSLDQGAKNLAHDEYVRSGRLPHRFWKDENGIVRPVYYKKNQPITQINSQSGYQWGY